MGQALSTLLDNGRIARIDRAEFSEIETTCRTVWASFIVDCMSSGKHGPSPYHVVSPKARLPFDEDSFAFSTEPTSPAKFLTRPLDYFTSDISSIQEHDALLNLEHYQTIVIKGLDIWSTLSQWICAGGRRIEARESSDAPWLTHTTWNRLSRALEHWSGEVHPNLWFNESNKNMQVYLSRGQGRQFAMVNFLLSINRIFLHREYIPFLPHRTRQPCGPIDPPLLSANAPENWWIEGSEKLFNAAATIVKVLQGLESQSVTYKTPFTCFCLFSAAAALAYAEAFPHMAPAIPEISDKLKWASTWLEESAGIWPICQGWHRILTGLVNLYDKVRRHADSLPTIGRDNFVELEETLHRFAEVETSPESQVISPAVNALLAMSARDGGHRTTLSASDTNRSTDEMLYAPLVESPRPDQRLEPDSLGATNDNLFAAFDDNPLYFDSSAFMLDDFARSQGLLGAMMGPSFETWVTNTNG